MKIKIQNLDWITQKIIKRFEKNPNSSISALFRELRRSPNLSLFADAPLIAHIVNTLASVGIYPKRSQISYACRYSPELKGRRSFLNSLLSANRSQLQTIIPSRKQEKVRNDTKPVDRVVAQIWAINETS